MKRTAMGRAGELVWAYLVVSDIGQADTLPDQEAWAVDAARTNGWRIGKVVSGVSSGKLGARSLGLAMIAELERLPASERPRRLLMIRLERLGRGNGLEAMEAFLRVRRLGIVVHTRLDGDVGYDRASELLMPVLRFFIGGMENEVRRDKLFALYERRRKAKEEDPTIAISQKAPYGLAIVNGRFVEKMPESEAVRLAYSLKIQGYGCHIIGKRLARVAPPWELKNGKVLPQRWTSDRVRRMLIKPAYRDVLVDADSWHRAQRNAREIRRPTIHLEYPLGGALRCECGHALVGVAAAPTSNPVRNRYYQCRNHLLHGSMKHHRAAGIEAQFLDILGDLACSDELIEQYSGAKLIVTSDSLSAQCTSLRAEFAKHDDRRRALFSAFEDGALDKSDLQWRLDDLRQKQKSAEEQIANLEREVVALRRREVSVDYLRRLVNSAASLWASAAVDDRRALAKSLGEAFGGFTVRLSGQLEVGSERSDEAPSPSAAPREGTH